MWSGSPAMRHHPDVPPPPRLERRGVPRAARARASPPERGDDASLRWQTSPCKRAYETFCRINKGWCHPDGTRCSWDIQALLYAVRGPEQLYELEPGHNVIDPDT